jgi:hypothetical protein
MGPKGDAETMNIWRLTIKTPSALMSSTLDISAETIDLAIEKAVLHMKDNEYKGKPLENIMDCMLLSRVDVL